MVAKDDFIKAVGWLYVSEVAQKMDAQGGDWWIFRSVDVDYFDLRDEVA